MTDMTEIPAVLPTVVTALDKHKAQEIALLDVRGLTPITDAFVLATGTGPTHVRALADYTVEEAAAAGWRPARVEGYADGRWVLLDFGAVIVHVFTEETRRFYDLERLWKDGKPLAAEAFTDGGADAP